MSLLPRLFVHAHVKARCAALVAVFLTGVLFGSAANAQPALFTGGVFFEDVYGTLPWATVPTALAPATATVTPAAGAASLMVPAAAFSNNTVFPSVTYVPGFPNLTFASMSNNGPGSFGPGFVPSTLTQYPNTTSVPNLTATPRSGFLRVIPGVNGFGGVMPLNVSVSVYGTESASVGYYDFKNPRVYQVGISAVQGGLAWGTKTHRTLTTMGGTINTGTGPLLTRQDVGAVTVRPFATGMATVFQPLGYYTTMITRTGVDGRNTAGTSGPLSLVSPSLNHRYEGPGGVLASQENARGLIWGVNMLLPEPGSAALLVSGCIALFGLGRWRSRIR